MILAFNWLYLGKPPACPSCLWLGRKLSGRQWARVRLLESLSEDGNSIFEVTAGEMARAAAKSESASDQLDALHRAFASVTAAGLGTGSYDCRAANVTKFFDEGASFEAEFGDFVDESDAVPFTTAKPIQASRISFVGRPAFDPLPFLMRRLPRSISSPCSAGWMICGWSPRVSLCMHALMSETCFFALWLTLAGLALLTLLLLTEGYMRGSSASRRTWIGID